MSVNIVVPALGESVVDATVGRWLKKEGDPVSVGETIVELETDKVDLEVGASQQGTLARIAQPQGSTVKVGDVLGVIEEAGGAQAGGPDLSAEASAKADKVRSTPGETKPAPAPTKATPSARREAREHGVELGEVTGTGDAGRVQREDVEQFVGRTAPDRSGASPSASAEASADKVRPTPEEAGPPQLEERIRMSRRRQTIARRLVEAQRAAAMLTTFNEVDMTAVMELRQRQKEAFKARHGVGLGIVSFFVKASIAALRAFPRLNAEVQGDEMVIKHYYDIGVAVGASEGLVVPVLREADRMSFADLEQAIKGFARKAEDGSLTLDDLRGGTFTITNGGVFGSLLSTPILNPPQVGILGLHKIQDRPIAIGGQVVIRPTMYVALSYDHRIVDGLEAVRFLVKVKAFVEDPGSLLLEG